MPLDAKDAEIQRLTEELKAAKEYSQVCEDESVELRRQLFDMTKQFKKLNKELERLSAAQASQEQAGAAPPASVTPTVPASRNTDSRRSICLARTSSESHINASDGGSDSCTSSGGDHSMDEGSALRRSARLRPSSAAHAVDASTAAVSKRKAPARASTVAAEGDGRLAPGSKKKRVTPGNTRSSEAVNASVEQVIEVVVSAVAREDRVVGQARQVVGRGGENPEQPTEEEQAPSSPPVTADEQMKLLDVLIEANLQLQEGWLPRMRALKQLKTLLTSPGHLKCEEKAFVDKMLPALVVQVSDARSQIVREACDIITAVLPTLNKYYADVARVLLPQMWKLTYITIKVMSESGTKCLLSIAEQMPIALFVSSICDAALDPHAMCRAQAAVCLKVLLERPKSHLQEDNLPTMCAILAKMLEDTSADVRTNAKAAFESLLKHWPQQGQALQAAAPEKVQRMLKVVGSDAGVGGSGATKEDTAKSGGKKMDIKALRLAAMQRVKKEGGGDVVMGGKKTHMHVAMTKENVLDNRA